MGWGGLTLVSVNRRLASGQVNLVQSRARPPVIDGDHHRIGVAGNIPQSFTRRCEFAASRYYPYVKPVGRVWSNWANPNPVSVSMWYSRPLKKYTQNQTGRLYGAAHVGGIASHPGMQFSPSNVTVAFLTTLFSVKMPVQRDASYCFQRTGIRLGDGRPVIGQKPSPCCGWLRRG